jgi:ribonuclease HII
MACGLQHERRLRDRGASVVAGVDEAGRGPLAGPVVAAAVVLPPDFRHARLTDSKKLAAGPREEIYLELTANNAVVWSVSVVENDVIDRINILKATHTAMREAVTALRTMPDHVLLDGLPVRPFPFPQTAIVRGDEQSLSIAAASVIAKVTRDRIMVEMDARHPGYEFAQHKGYGTALHLERLKHHGPCAIHRRSFLPVAQTQLELG